jgi:predicted ATPase
MLTRLKVNGFKNLVEADVRFGPFTCIAGANGVGKSNLFDAIHFLSILADRPLNDAALAVRDEGGRTSDIRSLFHRVGDDYDREMSFEAEMIVPSRGFDDFGQEVKASITFLRYSLALAYREARSSSPLELIKEELTYIAKRDAQKHLLFQNSDQWRNTAITGPGKRSAPNFISTEGEDENRIIKVYQGDVNSGRTLSRPAANLPRTVLSASNAAENSTALLARREMQSWRQLQLEPSSLRKSDELSAPEKLGSDGSHLPATLYRIAGRRPGEEGENNGAIKSAQIYSQISNRLSKLIDDVDRVGIEIDKKRESLTLRVTGRDGTSHPARALSDGTLRFIALAVLGLDSEAQGLICLEEPENGIHPDRIPAMLELLQDIATDAHEPVGPDNPLRQVIINTHSPSVVMQVPDESLIVASQKETLRSGRKFKRVSFGCLPDTWRSKSAPDSDGMESIPKGVLLSYLNPQGARAAKETDGFQTHSDRRSDGFESRRVMDRKDLQILLPLYDEAE